MGGQKSVLRAKTAESVKSWLIMLPGLILMTFFLWGPLLESIRYHVDKLELIVDDELWPLPKYRELLFIR